MFSRRRIKTAGDTHFTVGDVVELRQLHEAQEHIKGQKGENPTTEELVLGITEVSLSRGSFLSAASFQNTTKILIRAAVGGAEDRLIGLKENVILGRLIPAGTGFPGSPKQSLIREMSAPSREVEAEDDKST
jgi:DNA-directed RNA polymerase subunit beta'